MPGGSQSSRSSSPDGSRDGARDAEGGQDGDGDIRVASAERPGSDSEGAETGDLSTGSETGSAGGQVSAADALEAANAAVDAAAGAVEDAEATIDKAREAIDEQGGSGDSFDPWAEPAQSQASTSRDGGGAAGDSSEERDDAGGGQTGEESFDPFAVYNESAGGQSGEPGQAGRPSQQQISEASLEIADDALATANSALNRARRSLIEAAAAGSSDADAEAVQLAAARAALEAAAEAVVASAIAVLAAAASVEPTGEPITDPEEIQRAMEQFAAGLAMVVGVLHREMTSAAEALDATADLLTAAGSLIGMVGQTDMRPRQQADDGQTAGERVASLDEELEESLAVFDDRMTAEGGNSDPGFGEGEDTLAGLPAGGSADVGTAGSQSGGASRATGDRPVNRPDGEWAKPEYERKRPTATPEDIEDMILEEGPAQDDDIVARQLREAAAAETDPELRERLWEEYYAYKGSLERGEAETTQ